jgi:predicted PurR-regulated permease PerM
MALANHKTDDHLIERATQIIAALLVADGLYLGRRVLIPIALGLVLAGVLFPVVRWLQRLRLPRPAAAAIAILATIGALVAVTTALEPPVSSFVDEVPKSIAAARPKIDALAESFRRFTGIASARPSQVPSGGVQRREPPPAQSGGQTASPSTSVGQALGTITSLLGDIVEIILLALFILAAGDAWKDKIRKSFTSGERAHAVIDAASEMRAAVTRYLFVTALINLGQGVVIGLALWILGYPEPLLWGVLTFLLEFIPYLGGMVMIGLLLVVGLATTQSLVTALAGPAIYLVVTSLQNNLVSPIAYGRGMRLNPTAILVGLMVWWGLWGVAGAFLAVPILAAMNVVARRALSLRGLAAFLSD